MNEQTLSRLRSQLRDLRRADAWFFIRQLCTAAVTAGPEEAEETEKIIKEELGYTVDEEIAAARGRVRR